MTDRRMWKIDHNGKRELTKEEVLEVIKEEQANQTQPYGYNRNPNLGVIQDTMDAVLCHADGKMYDSKSEYRRTLKEHGMIEVGNELKDPEKRYKKESLAEIREKDRQLDIAVDKALAQFGIH